MRQAVYDAAWTFLLSAAAHLSDAESDPDKMCRTSLATLTRWLPDEGARERIADLTKSPVVRERLQFMPTMDDCAILLWYIHAADALIIGRKVTPSGIASNDAFAADPSGDAHAEAAALWVSPKREEVLAAIDHAWLGHAGSHPTVATARPALDLFVMSACPYGIASERVLFEEVLPLLGDTLDLRVRYITFSRFAGANGTAVPAAYCASPKALSGNKHGVALGAEEDVPCSMHGSAEANEDARQMAVYELHGNDKLREYILAFNGLGCAVDKYDGCSIKAAKAVNLDYAKIAQTALAQLPAYAAESKAVAEAVGYPAIHGTELSSPTLVINGHAAALGTLEPAVYVQRICAFYTAEAKPDACSRDKKDIRKAAQEEKEGGGEGRARAAVPTGASCAKADALPDVVPTPPSLQGSREGPAHSGTAALLPAAAAVLLSAAAVLAIVVASLRRGRVRGGTTPGFVGTGPGASASAPLV